MERGRERGRETEGDGGRRRQGEGDKEKEGSDKPSLSQSRSPFIRDNRHPPQPVQQHVQQCTTSYLFGNEALEVGHEIELVEGIAELLHHLASSFHDTGFANRFVGRELAKLPPEALPVQRRSSRQ